MATKISVSGVSKKRGGTNAGTARDYQEHEYSFTVDEDLSEDEAVSLVLYEMEQAGTSIYRRNRQSHDRITVESIGVQTNEPLHKLQLKDAKGRWLGYAAVGEQLWNLTHSAETRPFYGGSQEQDYAQYAKERGVSLKTGSYRREIRTTADDLKGMIERSVSGATWKAPLSGAEWRSKSPRKVSSGWRQEKMEDNW